jgi:hypothetical protein
MRPRPMIHMFFPITAAISLALFADMAKATPVTSVTFAVTGGMVTGSLTQPTTPGGVATLVDLSGVSAPSDATLTGADYTITFSNLPTGCGAGITEDGIVQNTDGCHAVPVAGETGSGAPEYLTGDLGSALTTSLGSSGNYLSTGLDGVITITFTSPQTTLELLWGSIDGCSIPTISSATSVTCSSTTPGNSLVGNSLTLNLNNGLTVTGYELGTDLAGLAGFTASTDYGGQGYGGSAWIIINATTPFTTVTLTSDYSSFEAAAIAAFDPAPEPASVFLVGTGLVVAALLRRSTLGKRLKNR